MLELIENQYNFETEDFNDYDYDYEEDNPNTYIVSEERWNDMALVSIDLFFANKKFHCGGKIPTNLLFSQKNIEIVRDSVRLFSEGFGIAIQAIYNVLHEFSPLRNDPITLNKPWDTIIVLKMMNEMHEMYIPKEFIPGLMLLNLNFCKGYNISKEIKNINKQMQKMLIKLK